MDQLRGHLTTQMMSSLQIYHSDNCKNEFWLHINIYGWRYPNWITCLQCEKITKICWLNVLRKLFFTMSRRKFLRSFSFEWNVFLYFESSSIFVFHIVSVRTMIPPFVVQIVYFVKFKLKKESAFICYREDTRTENMPSTMQLNSILNKLRFEMKCHI